MKKTFLLLITTLIVLINACGNNTSPKPTVIEKITLGLSIPTPPESVQFVEILLKQDEKFIVKGVSPEVFRKIITLSGNRLTVGTTRDLPVELKYLISAPSNPQTR